MKNRYEELRNNVLKGTKRAILKLVEKSKKEGKELVISDKYKVITNKK